MDGLQEQCPSYLQAYHRRRNQIERVCWGLGVGGPMLCAQRLGLTLQKRGVEPLLFSVPMPMLIFA